MARNSPANGVSLVKQALGAFLVPLSLIAILPFGAISSANASPTFISSNTPETLGSYRARLSEQPRSATGSSRQFAQPVALSDGSQLTLIAPSNWLELAEQLKQEVRNLHKDFTLIFGNLPPVAAKVRLLDEDTFFLSTGAPEWTNAMYFRGEILIPVPTTSSMDYQNLARALRHEYSHAIVHALTNGRCPGWLDEGLAQWAEGDENPALRPALSSWLHSNRPVPLKLLQGGFTKLKTDMVPAAYAQSLFAARTMIKTFGFTQMRRFFDGLRSEQSKDESFENAFEISLQAFERKLSTALEAWELARRTHAREL